MTEHGTRGGYRRHLRNRTATPAEEGWEYPPCSPCRAANRVAARNSWRKQKRRQR